MCNPPRVALREGGAARVGRWGATTGADTREVTGNPLRTHVVMDTEARTAMGNLSQVQVEVERDPTVQRLQLQDLLKIARSQMLPLAQPRGGTWLWE